jgi:hypothetical protein
MRLYELIDFTPRDTKRNRFQHMDRAIPNNKVEVLGRGEFGTAVDTGSNKRLNQVTKVGKVAGFDQWTNTVDRSSIKDDGYLSYLQSVYVAEKQGIQNPYFPVIHDLKIFKDDKNKLHYSVNLEKLLPFKTPKIINNSELLSAVCFRMFGKAPYNNKLQFIIENLDRMLSESNIAVDENLKDVAIMINDIISNNPNLRQDMHVGNVMWRITGNMPQLVIIDPIA